MEDEAPAIRPVFLVLLAAVLAVVVFVPSFSGDWIYDDRPLIAGNPFVHSFGSWTHWFTTDFWNVNQELVITGRRLIYWRPAIDASYAIDWKLGGGSPAFFHFMNLAWQAAMGALAFGVLRRWIGAAIPALVVAILFAIHPTKAESVAWVAGRTDVLCMVFLLLATEGMARRRRGARGGFALEITGTILAYLCKEQAIVLPAFAAIEAWVARDRGALDLPMIRALVRAALPQLILAIAYLAIRAVVLPIGTAGGSGSLPFGTHVGLILESYGRFTALAAAPIDLTIQQGLLHSTAGQIQLSMPYVVLGAIMLVATGALAIWLRRRRPGYAIGLGFFVLTLLPTSNVKYTQLPTLVSERFLYLPVLGLALSAGIALARTTAARRRIGYAIAGVIGLVFGGMSLVRSADYRTEEGFWDHELALHPDSGVAQEYMVQLAISKKDYAGALKSLMSPRGDAYDRDRRDELRRAFVAASVAAQLAPDHDVARLRRIDAFCATLLTRDHPKAILVLDAGELAIATTGDSFPTAMVQVQPWLTTLRVDIANRLGDEQAALALADRAVASCPTCGTVVPSAIYANAAAGHYDRAHALLATLVGAIDEDSLTKIATRLDKAEHAHDAGLNATGVEALRVRGAELSALELWGRAYDVFAPYLADVESAPKAAARVAELAFRAGEPAVARRLLIAASPLNDIDETFARWSKSMGW